MESYIDKDGKLQHQPFRDNELKKTKRKSKKKKDKKKDNNRPTDWNLVAELALRAEEQHYFCPICTEPIPGNKRNLRLHLREDHTQAEAVSYLVSWSDFYDDEDGVEQEVEVDFITGTHLRLFIPGKEILRKLKQHKHEPTYENFKITHNVLVAELASYMSDILMDKDYNPIEEASEDD